MGELDYASEFPEEQEGEERGTGGEMICIFIHAQKNGETMFREHGGWHDENEAYNYALAMGYSVDMQVCTSSICTVQDAITLGKYRDWGYINRPEGK